MPWWIREWAGDVVATVLIVGFAFAPFPDPNYRASGPLIIALMILPVLLLPFRRRWPVVILGLCVALFGVTASTGVISPGIVLAIAIAMFGVAVRSSRRTTFIVALIAVVATLGLSLLAIIGTVFDPRSFQLAVTVAFAAAFGDATRSRREYIQAITDRAVRAEESRDAEARRRVTEERLRIARDLHDAVAHQISVISLNAGVASSALDSRPEAAKEALGTIRTASRAVLAEIGDLLEMLRTADGSTDARTTPQAGLDRLDELLARFRSAGLEVTVRVEGDPGRLPVATDLVAYRVIQEALTNAHKHGSPRRAHVLVTVGDAAAHIVVTNPVADRPDGEPASPTMPGGHGLLGLRERVASVRGTVDTGPTPGGYRVQADLPLAKEAA